MKNSLVAALLLVVRLTLSSTSLAALVGQRAEDDETAVARATTTMRALTTRHDENINSNSNELQQDGPRNLQDDSSRTSTSTEGVVYDVVVIGAGWAGIAAARALQEEGGPDLNFVVLEADERIGGRCRTETLKGNATTAAASAAAGGTEGQNGSNSNNNNNDDDDGIMVELGCQWLHGASKLHPVYNLAVEAGMSMIPSTYESTGYWSNAYNTSEGNDINDVNNDDGDNSSSSDGEPHRVNSTDFQEFVRKYYRESFKPFYKELGKSVNNDKSLRVAADRFVAQNNVTGNDRLAFETALDTKIVHEYAADLNDLSLWWWNEDYWLDSEAGDAILLGLGQSGVLEYATRPVKNKIRLSTQITSVNWSPTGNKDVVVSYRNSNDGTLHKITAKNVIVTVSLGVLQEGSIRFSPALPRLKRDAIKRLGQGLYNKAFVVWNDDQELPWPNDVEWLVRIAPLGQQVRTCIAYFARFRLFRNKK